MDEFYRNISRPYWLIAPNDVNNISIKVKNALAEQYNGVSFQSVSSHSGLAMVF
jgi:hypothetical protein